MILKMNLKTPGREDEDEETRLISKAEYKASRQANPSLSEEAIKAEAFLSALGGKENIEDVTNCATRLRVTVKDEKLVAPAAQFKEYGAHGLVEHGRNFQVIVGLSVPTVREEFENRLY